MFDHLPHSLRRAAEAASGAALAVIAVDATGKVVWANDALSDVLPLEPADVVGEPLDAVRLTPLAWRTHITRAEYYDPFGGTVGSESIEVVCGEGALLLELGSDVSGDGELDRLRSGLISTETMLRESQQLYREVFENSTDLIQSADIDGRLLFANDAWLRRLGYDSAQLGRLSLEAVVAPGYEDVLEVFRCETGPGPHSVRAEFVAASGARVWVDGSVAQRKVRGVPVGTHAILRDVTEAERLRQMKDEFVSMVNHEMRTPLTSISGSIGLLLDGVGGELPPKAMEFLEIASRNVDRLTNIVSDVLDAERLAFDRLRVEQRELSVGDVVRDVADEHRGHATRESVTIEVDPVPGSCMSDGQRLNQILANFLANAIRHSPARSRVMLSVRFARDVARFSVLDQGDGVPVDFRPHILERFSQAPGSEGGSGLGLGIAAALGDRLGGATGYWSLEGIGSVFWVDLPAESSGAHRVVTPSSYTELLRELGANPAAELSLANLDKAQARWVLEQLSSCPDHHRLVVRDCPDEFRDAFSGFFELAGQNDQ